MYLHFLQRQSSLNKSDPGPYYTYEGNQRGPTVPTVGSHGRNQTIGRGKRGIFDITLNSQIEHPRIAPGNHDDNLVWSECRRASSARSATASEIPLEPQIQKRTEFYVHEDGLSETSHADQIEVAEERGSEGQRYV